jgi:hypothetical protein
MSHLLTIYIPSCNNGWMVKRTVDILQKKFPNPIVILDNNSVHEKTKQTLKELESTCQVIYYTENKGPWIVQKDPEFEKDRQNGYILTDPDLGLESLPDDAIEVFWKLAKEFKSSRVGPALRIDEVDDMLPNIYYNKETVIQWEKRFWQSKLKHPHYDIYSAPIDTTFYVYNPEFNNVENHLRIAGDYQVRHLPWHQSFILNIDPEDFDGYFAGKHGIWSNTGVVIRDFLKTYHPDKFTLHI